MRSPRHRGVAAGRRPSMPAAALRRRSGLQAALQGGRGRAQGQCLTSARRMSSGTAPSRFRTATSSICTGLTRGRTGWLPRPCRRRATEAPRTPSACVAAQRHSALPGRRTAATAGLSVCLPKEDRIYLFSSTGNAYRCGLPEG